MTIRIALLPYGPSDSCVALRDAVRQVIVDERLDARITLLRAENSAYRARNGDVLINYGNRRMPQAFFGQATVLNSLAALNRAANKLQALDTMSAAGVSTIEYTASRETAQDWLRNGATVYSRATLNGHSGEGIEVHQVGPDGNLSSLPRVPLYTKGITSQRREWRVHVFKGVITYVQKKIRRNGYREDANYREDVRNHHTGWVYSNQFTDTPSDAVLRNAFDAVAALGLDFGAVDVISRGEEAWVLEVNTAPGLSGTTLDTYKANMVEFAKSVVLGTEPAYSVAYAVPAPIARTEAVVEEVAPVAAPVIPEAPQTLATPPAEAESLGIRISESRRERGFYLCNVRTEASNVSFTASNVILYHVNGRFYRHGWNQPIDSNLVANIRKIESVSIEGNTNPITL